MVLNKLVFKKKKAIIYSLIIAIVFFAMFLMILCVLFDSIKQREKLETTDRFMVFESNLERLIYSNVTLLQGYEAYIELNPNLEEEKADAYLDILLLNSSDYIRNVGVIQDTTIIWNYPKSSNLSAIGVNLLDVESQRDLVLKVKEEFVPVLQGPVELVQGGKGFIVRLPIVREETGYWGQISVILKSDMIIKEINRYAKEAELNIAVFNQEDENIPFSGNMKTVGKSALEFNIDPSFINWKVFVSPESGWKSYALFYLLANLFLGTISVYIGLTVYKTIKSNYQLRNSSTHDYLSGLLNRHFLDEYQKNIFEEAKTLGYNVGFLSMDLNGFKLINDTYGHGVGDLVLIETARILEDSIKDKGVTFRLGGDEFLIIVPKTKDRIELLQIKELLQNRFKEDLDIPDHSIKVTPSIGCSMFPEDGDNIDVLLKSADRLMYIEKKYFSETSIHHTPHHLM